MTGAMLFWDASAVVPLLLPEGKSTLAKKVWEEARGILAWHWLQVEVDAALIRRSAEPDVWRTWGKIEARFDWADFNKNDINNLRTMNRSLGLRSADAAHVFVFEKLNSKIHELQMVTFDQEMVTAVQRLGLAVHPACIQS